MFSLCAPCFPLPPCVFNDHFCCVSGFPIPSKYFDLGLCSLDLLSASYLELSAGKVAMSDSESVRRDELDANPLPLAAAAPASILMQEPSSSMSRGGGDEESNSGSSRRDRLGANPLAAVNSASLSMQEPSPSTSRGEEPNENRNLYVSEIIPMWNLTRLVLELRTTEQCLQFAINHELIIGSKLCRTHRRPMRLDYCDRGNCKRTKIARTEGTWFHNIKIELPHVFYLMYAYAHQFSHETVIFEDILRTQNNKCLSSATITDWYNYCRETIVIDQIKNESNVGRIGGPGKIVQIDESKFSKRKYKRGRHVEGHWVLGLIEDGSEDLRLEVCPENIRSAEELVPLIKKHLIEGRTIHTDCWRAYDCLENHGYIHKKVNHSDPDNPFVAEDGTHTQRIEPQWRVIKRFFYKDNYDHLGNFADMIVEYQWQRRIKKKKYPFLSLINAVKDVYKPK